MTTSTGLRKAAKEWNRVREDPTSSIADMVAADEMLYRKAREFVHAEDARKKKKAVRSHD